MRGRRNFPVVRNLAHVPQSLDGGAAGGQRADLLVTRSVLEHQYVLGDRRAGETRQLRRRRERGQERAERGEVELAIAPLEHLQRLEHMAFQRMCELGVERRAAAGGAESAVAGGTAGTAGDLGEFRRVEATELVAVELSIRRK